MSQKSCDSIKVVLEKHFAQINVSIVNNISDIEAVVAIKPDLIFMGLKFVPTNESLGRNDPEKIWLSKYLDDNGIRYTGSDEFALNCELNKEVAKARIKSMGISTSPFFVTIEGQKILEENIILNYPLFVKPSDRGGGLGIDENSVVHNFVDLLKRVDNISKIHSSNSLVEEYLPGREFSVAIMKNSIDGEYVQMPIEIIAEPDNKGNTVLSSATKALNEEVVVIVKDLCMNRLISEFAQNVFNALGAEDYGRIDIRLDVHGRPMFLEANLLPSLLSNYGNFPKACSLYLGMNHEAMILEIVKLGLGKEILPVYSKYNDFQPVIEELLLPI